MTIPGGGGVGVPRAVPYIDITINIYTYIIYKYDNHIYIHIYSDRAGDAYANPLGMFIISSHPHAFSISGL